MREVVTKVYTFAELEPKAKEKARDWLRQFVFTESHDWEFVYEDAKNVAELFGLIIATRTYSTRGGGNRGEPAIYFSGFSSQGDGACFEGRYEYREGALELVMEYAPKDEELHSIVADIQEAQGALKKARGFTLIADCKNTGRGSASHDMGVSFDATDYPDPGIDADETMQAETAVKDGLRRFADWIYSQLRSEYEHRSSDDEIDESMAANGYEFTADGKRARD